MTRWRLGEAEIEALLAAGELQVLVGDAAQGEPWLTKAARTLQTATSVRSSDPSSAYVLGYDAARYACVGLLAQQGLRPTTKGGHYAVERAVTAQFKDRLGTFGSLRRRRNQIEYPTTVIDEVDAEEITEALETIATMLDQAAMLLPNLGLFTTG
jgi:hypothetical protein